MPDTKATEAHLAQVIGLYLSFSYVVLPVACLFCWRRGQAGLAVAMLVAPIAAWGLWELSSGLLSPFKRLHLGSGLLPAALYAPLAAMAWLMSLAMTDGDVTSALAKASFPAWARGGVRLAGTMGLVWFLYGFARLENACPMSVSALRSQLPRAALCASSAAGTWPLLLPLVLGGIAGFVRDQQAGNAREGVVR